MPRARFAAEQAVKLDESLPEAHLSLALVLTSYDWNSQAAEREFRRTIELKPQDAAAHMYFGIYWIYRARLDQAFAELTLARDLDPLTPIYSSWLAYLSYLNRRYDEAADQYKKILEMDPTFATARYTLGLIYVQQQKYPEAYDEFAKAKAYDPESFYPEAILGQAYGMAGRKGEARKILAELTSRSKREYVDPACIALIYAGLGDNDQAFAWLDKAFEAKSEEILTLKVNPRYDALRSDPRLAALIARAGF
jgi:serine/threonine-protein kinase